MRTGHRITCHIVIAAAAFPALAHGDTAAQSDLEVVMVTATRREESLQDVAISMTALSAEVLDRNQITDVKSLSAQTPSLLITDTPVGKNNMIVGMRGITPTSISSNNDPTVGIYVNGVYYARTAGANAALIDMQQIEVIRGPQGTLFGRNTIGGALNMTTQRPTDDFELTVKAGAGNYDQLAGGVVANMPLIGDKLTSRLVFDHMQHDGYGRSVTLDRQLSDEDRDYYRAAVRFAPTEDVELDLYYDKFSSHTNSQVWIVTYFDPSITAPSLAGLAPFVREGGFDSTAGFDTGNTVDVENTSLTATWKAPFATLKSITAYRDIATVSGYDLDATPAFINQIQRYGVSGDQFSQELQAFGKALDDRLDWIGGLYYLGETVEDSSLVTSPSGANTLGRLNQFEVDQTSTSAFAEVGFAFTAKLRATAGARWVRDEKGIEYYSPRYILETGVPLAGSGGCPLIAAGLNQGGCRYSPPDMTFDYVPWTVGLDYKPNADGLIYAKVSTGFRSGGFQPAGATTAAGYAPFQEEKVVSNEIGIKWQSFDSRLRWDIAAYWDEYSDIQQIAPHIPAGSTVTVSSVFNAGEATVKGVELDVNLKLGELDMRAGLGVMDPEFTTGPYKGLPFVTAAKRSYSVGADYPLQFGDARVTLHADYQWRSDVTFFVPVNTNTTPFSPLTQGQIDSNLQDAYGLLNAMISFDLGQTGLRMSVWGRNLTDEYYKARSNSFYLQGYNTITPGDPRTAGVTVEYQF